MTLKVLINVRYRTPIFYATNTLNKELYGGMLIDKVVTESLEQKYSSASNYEKRIYNRFFERYQNLSTENTIDRIAKINLKSFY